MKTHKISVFEAIDKSNLWANLYIIKATKNTLSSENNRPSNLPLHSNTNLEVIQ